MRLLGLFLVLSLLATACAPAGGPAERAADEPLGAEEGLLRVTQDLECCYTEGSFSYLRVVTQDGREVLEREYGPGEDPRLLLEEALPPGAYRLESWQRPCSASCPPTGALDPPTDGCEAPFELQAGWRLEAVVEVAPGNGCTIALGAEAPPTLVPEAFDLRERYPSCGSEYLFEEEADQAPRECLLEAHRAGRPAELESTHLDQGGNPIRRWYRITPEGTLEAFVDATASGAETWERFRCSQVSFAQGEGAIEIVPEECTDPEQLAVDRTRLPGDATLLALDPESGEVRWRVPIAGEGLSAPAAGEETVYLISPAGGFTGMLRAFDAATGAERWRFVTGRLLTLRPVVGQGLVYLSLAGMEGDGGAEVLAVDAETGAERWRSKVGGEANPPPLLWGEVLYVGTDHPRLLLALDAGTGEVRWQTDLSGPVPGTPAVGSALLYVAVPLFADVSGGPEDRSEVMALDPETGGVRWSQSVRGIVSGSPAVANRDVYLGLRDFSTGTGTLIALSAETGEERWRFTSEGEIATSPTVAGDLVLVADLPFDRNSNLYAVDAHSGQEQWRGALAGEVAEPAAVEGEVLYLSDRRGLSALELETGQERWLLEVTAAEFSGGLTAPTLHERLLYVGQS